VHDVRGIHEPFYFGVAGDTAAQVDLEHSLAAHWRACSASTARERSATQPILLFAVGFGLATDYGVLLLSRIKEAYDGGASNSDAVAIGLERTGRLVTSAAVLFAVAIGAFAVSEIVFIKELGVGAALAVLIDASIIRALLVPSLMALLGSLNWWAPAPLRRLYERVRLREEPGPGRAVSMPRPSGHDEAAARVA
jgi:RND superfamily putative drug exporter